MPPLIWLDEGLGQLGCHLLERGVGVWGESLVICQEGIPHQLQAQLPGGVICGGLQEVGQGAELLKPGEEILPACPGKRLDVIEALVGDEAAWMAAGGWQSPECGQLGSVLSLLPCVLFCRCIFPLCPCASRSSAAS